MAGELSDAVIGFIEGGVSIIAASRDGGNGPALGRCLAVRVAPDRRCVTVLVGAEGCGPLLQAVADSRSIAVVFTQPTTHRSLQLKGTDATVAPLAPADADLAARHAAAFAAELRAIGFAEPFVNTYLAMGPPAAAVSFSAEGAFDQTPGPRAGDALAP